ncbi:MAG: ABC transporter permease [Sandaracinaceae bacterium]|nr:ABC transporter permease [Sandaracinaceae bacterium]
MRDPRVGVLGTLLRRRRSRIAFLGMVTIIVAAVFAHLLASTSEYAPFADPWTVHMNDALQGPSWSHWLGTDHLGRDVAARVLHGTRGALGVAAVSIGLVLVIGLFFGAVGGFYGGQLDSLVSRAVEVLLSVPTILAVLAMRGITGEPRLLDVAIVIGLLRWTEVARLTRAEVLRARGTDWVLAAFALGLPPRRILVRHILPDAITPAITAAPFVVALAITIESTMPILGVHPPPGVISWGEIIAQARAHRDAWWLAVFPGIAICLAIGTFNVLGESLRDAIDPHLRGVVDYDQAKLPQSKPQSKPRAA